MNMAATMTTGTHTLDVFADTSVLTDADQDEVVLGLSPRTIAAQHWPLGRPSALALERAIDDVENAIERSGLVHANRGALHAGDGLRALLLQMFRPPGRFSRYDVEAQFSRLVASAWATGTSATTGASAEAAAALLLLRELMHHLGFQTLQTTG